MELFWKSEPAVRISGGESIRGLAQDFNISTKTTSPYLSNLTNNILLDRPKEYQSLVGRLLFVARMWRPDILYVVGTPCTKSSKATGGDWQKALHVVKYLFGTADEGIEITPWDLSMPVEVFTDAGEEKLEEKATTGILVRTGASLVDKKARCNRLVIYRG